MPCSIPVELGLDLDNRTGSVRGHDYQIAIPEQGRFERPQYQEVDLSRAKLSPDDEAPPDDHRLRHVTAKHRLENGLFPLPIRQPVTPMPGIIIAD